MKLAVMAIGIPGAGKTTLLKPLAEQYGLAYINRDDIREELLGDARDQSNNKAVWEEANRRTAAALKSGAGVVLDATFLERWKRKDMTDFLRAAGAARIVGVIFDTPFEVARERNRGRERVVKDETMQWMRTKLAGEPPAIEDGFDALYLHEDIGGLSSLEF